MYMYEVTPLPSHTAGAQVLLSMKCVGSLNRTISSPSPSGTNADFNLSPGTARSSRTSESSQEAILTRNLDEPPLNQRPRIAARIQDQGRKRDRTMKNRCPCKIGILSCCYVVDVPHRTAPTLGPWG